MSLDVNKLRSETYAENSRIPVTVDATAEEDAHWDPVLGEDGKLVRNRWQYEGEEREGKWVHDE